MLYFRGMPVDILAHLLRRGYHGAMELIPPAETLAQVVAGYYIYTHGQHAVTWASIDGHPALVFLLDHQQVHFTGVHARVLDNAFFCCGSLRGTYVDQLPAGSRWLIVRFSPDGWKHLHASRRPAAPFTPVTDVWGEAGLQLAAAIRTAGTVSEQTTLLNIFLDRMLIPGQTGNFMLQAATAKIQQERGQLSVQDLCAKLKVNYKWLERNFRQELGVTPKVYMDNIRFLHAYLDVRDGRQGLTHVALDNGYYDQQHFIKVYKKFTGTLPAAERR